MSKPAFTPGPWRNPKGNARVVCNDAGDKWLVRSLLGGPKNPSPRFLRDREQAEANAKLIASAPELYEALRYARRFLKAEDHDIAYIDAALAKAVQ